MYDNAKNAFAVIGIAATAYVIADVITDGKSSDVIASGIKTGLEKMTSSLDRNKDDAANVG